MITRTRLGVVIPIYNRKEKTIRCLESIYSNDLENIDLEVVVVDDGSTDNSVGDISNLFPNTQFIRGNGNWYWTKSVNKGLEFALTKTSVENILVLNNDTILDRSAIQNLIGTERIYPNAIIGACILFYSKTDTIRFAGSKWSFLKLGWYYPHCNKKFSQINKIPFLVNGINGNCCLIPRTIFESYGLYDEEKFPHCYADSAFTIGAKKNGVDLFINPNAVVWDDDTDLEDKNIGSYNSVRELIDIIFFSPKSAYNYKAFFYWHWLFSPNKISGLLIYFWRLIRLLMKIFLAIMSIRDIDKTMNRIIEK